MAPLLAIYQSGQKCAFYFKVYDVHKPVLGILKNNLNPHHVKVNADMHFSAYHFLHIHRLDREYVKRSLRKPSVMLIL